MQISLLLSTVAPDDLEELVALRIEAMRPSLERIGRFDPARARVRFASGFAPEHTRHIVVDGRRVGFVVVKPLPHGWLLDHLYVEPASQGRGIGAAALARVLDEADQAGAPVSVSALRESASNRFYLRHGFNFVRSREFDNDYIRAARA